MSTTSDLAHVQWVKSSYSGNGGGSCIEWAPSYATTGLIPVRDSKDPEGPVLAFSPGHWRTFAGRVKAGTFRLA